MGNKLGDTMKRIALVGGVMAIGIAFAIAAAKSLQPDMDPNLVPNSGRLRVVESQEAGQENYAYRILQDRKTGQEFLVLQHRGEIEVIELEGE